MARRVLEEEMRVANGEQLNRLQKAESLDVIKEVKVHKTFNGVFSMQFNYNGTQLAVGFGSGGIQLYNPLTGEVIKDLRQCRHGGYAVMAMRFHPQDPDLLYACTSEGHIYIYNCVTGEMVHKIEEQGNEINTIDFSVDGYNFTTGGKDLSIRVYETKKNKIVRKYEGYNESTVDFDTKVCQTMRVFSIKFSPKNEHIFISGGWDNHIKIWDSRDNEGILRNIHGPHICGDALDFKDNTILAGCWSALHSLQMYDYTNGNVVKEVKYPHKDGAFLYSASYCNDNIVMAGGSGTNRLEVMEISTDRHIGGYKVGGPVHCSDSANDGRLIAVGGASQTFAILRLNGK